MKIVINEIKRTELEMKKDIKKILFLIIFSYIVVTSQKFVKILVSVKYMSIIIRALMRININKCS